MEMMFRQIVLFSIRLAKNLSGVYGMNCKTSCVLCTFARLIKLIHLTPSKGRVNESGW